MQKRGSIELKIFQQIQDGYAIYIQECLEDKTLEVSQRLDILEKTEWFVVLSFTEEKINSKEGFRYKYFVASWDDPSKRLPQEYPERFISFDKLREGYLRRTETLEAVGNDQWFVFSKRFFINVSFFAKLPQNEAVYITGTLSDSEFDKKLVKDGIRMSHLQEGIWKIQLDYSVEDIMKLNGDFKFVIFKSYSHCRDENYSEQLNKKPIQIENTKQIIQNLKIWQQKQQENPENSRNGFMVNINFTDSDYTVEIQNISSTSTSTSTPTPITTDKVRSGQDHEKIENIDHLTNTVSSLYVQLNTQLNHYNYDKCQKLNTISVLNGQIKKVKVELENLFEQKSVNFEEFSKKQQQLKELLTKLVSNLPNQQELQQILDWCASQIKIGKQSKDHQPQKLISQNNDAMKDKPEPTVDFTFIEDEMSMVRLLKISKEWGSLVFQNDQSQKDKENEFYNIFCTYLKCHKTYKNQMTNIILLYYYDHLQEFSNNLKHEGFQNGFESQIEQKFTSFKVDEKTKKELRTDDAYQLLDQFINYPLQMLVKQPNVMVSIREQYLFKFLLEFILLYSFGRNVNFQIGNLKIQKCTQFSPFCQDEGIILTNKYLYELSQQKQIKSPQVETKPSHEQGQQVASKQQEQPIKTGHTDTSIAKIKMNIEEILKVQDLNKINQEITAINDQLGNLSHQIQQNASNVVNPSTQKMVNPISQTPIKTN